MRQSLGRSYPRPDSGAIFDFKRHRKSSNGLPGSSGTAAHPNPYATVLFRPDRDIVQQAAGSRHDRKTAGSTQDDDGPAAGLRPKPNALIVDRDSDAREFVVNALAEDFCVESAAGVREGLKKLRLSHPDIVVCALTLLQKRGNQLLSRLRAGEGCQSTPILIVAPKLDDPSHLGLLQGLVQDYITLPCPPAELAVRVLNLLEANRRESQLKDVSQRLLSAQEDERKRIARELHDDLSQRLGVLSMKLSSLESRPPASQDEMQSRVHDIGLGVDRLAKGIHELSRGLHPAVLQNAGLEAAIRSECANFTARENLAIRLSTSGVPGTLREDISLCVYRVLQESLNNIVKHAGAEVAEVTLTGRKDHLQLEVTDSGAGFLPCRNHLGLGLTSMSERAHLCNGVLEIKSTLGQGTCVKLFIPLGKEQTNAATKTANRR